MESVCFDVTAKYLPGTKFSDRWLMLRSQLEDRFKLAVHHESKEMPGYALIVSKSGFKLKPSDPGEGSTTGGNQGRVWTFRARKIEMSTLAYELADSLGDVVVDTDRTSGCLRLQAPVGQRRHEQPRRQRRQCGTIPLHRSTGHVVGLKAARQKSLSMSS